MSRQSGPYYANQRDIRLRHDAHLWIRHDIKRFFKPGTDLADVVPALLRRRDAEDAAFAAEIAKGYRLLAVLREEVASIRADLLRRRQTETKYSPDQPRVPKRNPGGGQFARIGGNGQLPSTGIAQPMGDVDVGDLSGSNEIGDLFQITPDDTSTDGEQVADVVRVCTVAGAGRATVDGVKSFFVIYECFGGNTFRREGLGHNFPGIVRDPFR